jgi:hypothetical protein
MKPLIAALCALSGQFGSVCAANQTVYGINWLSDRIPCVDEPTGATNIAFLGGPITSPYYPDCVVRGTKVSICPNSQMPYPWDQGMAISIIGGNLSIIASDRNSQVIAELGSGHGGDGADVFLRAAGVGNTTHAVMFPSGMGIPQGAMPGYSHLDLYAACDGGPDKSMQVLLDVFYTSP